MNKKEHPRSLLWRFVCIMTLLLLVLSVFSIQAFASNMDSSDETMEILEQGETVHGPGFFSGDSVQIDGNVDGTTFAAGNEVHVNGTINGSLFVAAQTIIIRGEVTGNIYVAGQSIQLAGQSRGDIFLAGATIIVNPQAQIGRDLFAAGSSIVIESSVPRHLYGAGQQLTLNGTVGGNVSLDAEKLTLQESAVIEGDLNYTSPQEAQTHSNATVNGEVNWTESAGTQAKQEPSQASKIGRTLLGMLWSILSSLVVWFMFRLWRPDFWKRAILPLSESPLKTIGVGLLALIVTPFAALLFMLTIIGIPFGLILLFLYLLLLYLSHIVVAVFIGFWLTNRLKWKSVQKEILFVLLGLIILELIGWVPILNFIVGLVSILIGLGTFILAYYKSHSSHSL